jgi:hypothetical protein
VLTICVRSMTGLCVDSDFFTYSRGREKKVCGLVFHFL